MEAWRRDWRLHDTYMKLRNKYVGRKTWLEGVPGTEGEKKGDGDG